MSGLFIKLSEFKYIFESFDTLLFENNMSVKMTEDELANIQVEKYGPIGLSP